MAIQNRFARRAAAALVLSVCGLSASAGGPASGGSGAHGSQPGAKPAATPPAPAPAKPAGPAVKSATTELRVPAAELAINMLKEGNDRFLRGMTQQPNRDLSRVLETAAAQHPFATILTCSDSRLPPELIFDRGIGELFIIRVAGNVCDTDEAGTIEYGVGHLGTPLVVVLGHSSCGAVKAVASGAEVHGNIPGLVDNIVPAVQETKAKFPELTGDELVNAAVAANVWRSAEDLLVRSEEVRELIEARKVKLVGAVYDLATGEVEWLGEHPRQQEIIQAALAAKESAAPAQAAHEEAPATGDQKQAAGQAKPKADSSKTSAAHDDHHDGHATPHRR